MKVMLVRPAASAETIGLQHVMLVEPLELEVLGTLVGEDDEAVVVDMLIEQEPFGRFLERERPDVLCVTGYITNVPRMLAYCAEAKRYGNVTTVVGGVHCEVCPDDLRSADVDYRVVRNAVTAFPQLLAHLRGGTGVPAGVLPGDAPFTEAALPPFDFTYPAPDRTLTARYRHRYFYIFQDKVALVKTAFGCPHRCSFCFCRRITRDAYHERGLEAVFAELEGIAETEIYIVDDNFLTTREKVTRFLDGIEARGIRKRYLIYGRADFIAANPDVMERFRDDGLGTVIVGIESFSDDELDRFNKRTSAAVNERAVQTLHGLGIGCFATVIVPPEWGHDDFDACARRLVSLGVHFVNLQPLTPLPGTEFGEPPENVLLDRQDYEKWDLAHIAVRPRRMDEAAFYKALLTTYGRILFRPSVIAAYLRTYPFRLLVRMLVGSYRVRRQYLAKYREARRRA